MLFWSRSSSYALPVASIIYKRKSKTSYLLSCYSSGKMSSVNACPLL
jgi:hypothetical protein